MLKFGDYGNEELRGARFVSPLFCEFSLAVFVLGCVVFCCLFALVLLVKILHSITVSLLYEFPVVDRLCPVLARQCRKKKEKSLEFMENCEQ